MITSIVVLATVGIPAIGAAGVGAPRAAVVAHADAATPAETTADWPAPRYGATRTNSNPSEQALPPGTVQHLGLAWTDDSAMAGEPAVVGGRLFAVCGDALCAFDSRSGTPAWKTPLPSPGYAIEPTSPTVVGSTVYLASGCAVLALDATTGAVIWSMPCTTSSGEPDYQNNISDPPVVDGNQVFASTYYGDIDAYNATTGEAEWSTNIGGYYATLSAANGWVYATGAGWNGTVVPVRESDGWVPNRFRSPRDQDSMLGGAALADGRVFAGLAQFQQEQNWDPDVATNLIIDGAAGPAPLFDSEGTPAVAAGKLYYTTSYSGGCCSGDYTDPNDPVTLPGLDMVKETAFDKGSIAPGWQTILPANTIGTNTLGGNRMSGATVADGVVYATTYEGWLIAANASDGQLLWTYDTHQTPIPPFAMPTAVVANGMVYVVEGQTLYAFAPADAGSVPPAAPTDLMTMDNDGSVTLAWSAPPAGDPATSYTVTVQPSGRVIPVAGTTTTVTGLHDWTRYRFTITPRNAAGAGPPLASSTITPRPSVTIASVGAHHQVRLRDTTGWRNLGGFATSAPAVVSSSGTPYIFVRSADHNIWVRTPYDGWRPFGPASTDCASAPAAALFVDKLTVACRNSSDDLQLATVTLSPSQLPSISAWTTTKVAFRGTPAVMATGRAPNYTTIVMRGPAKNVASFEPATGWNPPVRCSRSPAAVNDASGHIAIACSTFYKTFDHVLEVHVPEDPSGSTISPLNPPYPYLFHGVIAIAWTYYGHVTLGLDARDHVVEYEAPAYKWGAAGSRESDNFAGWATHVIGSHALYGVAATGTYELIDE